MRHLRAHSNTPSQLPFPNEAAVSAALLKSQSGDAALEANSFVSVGMWHRVRKLNARLHKRYGVAAPTQAPVHAAEAASSSSSDSGSSDSEFEGGRNLLPFKADTARAANGASIVSTPLSPMQLRVTPARRMRMLRT